MARNDLFMRVWLWYYENGEVLVFANYWVVRDGEVFFIKHDLTEVRDVTTIKELRAETQFLGEYDQSLIVFPNLRMSHSEILKKLSQE